MFAKRMVLLVCLAVMSIFLLPGTALAGDVYVGTVHGKDIWLSEETIVLEEGIYRVDTKNVKNGELDSVWHWEFVTDGRHWYFLRGKNEQLEQTAGSPIRIERMEIAKDIFNYCVEYIENRK